MLDHEFFFRKKQFAIFSAEYKKLKIHYIENGDKIRSCSEYTRNQEKEI
jgi:hypothetical protein